MSVIFVAALFVFSWLCTGVVRAYAVDHAVLDVPNARSSHTVPTPRGGGLAIVLATVAGSGVLAASGNLPLPLFLAVGGGGMIVAIIGWIDDHRGVHRTVRASVHFIAAGWALVWLGGLPVVRLGTLEVELGPTGFFLCLLGIVWMTNLYNFMDGIDGLAAGQAVCVGIAAGALLLFGGAPSLAMAALVTAAGSAGFLVWNWAPARIFMGDAGSGFLGFVFGTLAVASENAGAFPVVGWVLLMGVFVLDATVTLGRRLLQGARVYEAHRSHAYQRAVQAGYSHARVSAVVLGLNAMLAALAALWLAGAMWLAAGFAAGTVLLTLVYLRVEACWPMHSDG